MPSLIPTFEYDIFISYRHNDNRSGWVTEFVNALQEELASTIKEPLTIYFDRNPHNGLLETHNVDKSLEGKLKCLIFIPIISQTYCDTKSFAWQHEFVAFNRMASGGSAEESPLRASPALRGGSGGVGRDIKLSNGNVASRILPIKIHDLDAEDKSLIENEIGGALRAIEFIFKSSGVNRPLRAIEDHPQDNLNKTYYRDQINKVANAIKSIVAALNHQPAPSQQVVFSQEIKRTSQWKKQIALGVVAVLVVAVLAYFLLLPPSNKAAAHVEKSIAVLPFANMTNDAGQEYFSDGVADEIRGQLTSIGGLKVISRSSSMYFKGKNVTMKEIAEELKVTYILEGTVRNQNKDTRISIQLTNALDDRLEWAPPSYSLNMENIFEVQESIAKTVVEKLKLTLTPNEEATIERRFTQDPEIYDLYLKARHQLGVLSPEGWKNAEDLCLEIISREADFYPAHAILVTVNVLKGMIWGTLSSTEAQKAAMPFFIELNKSAVTFPEFFMANGAMKFYLDWDFEAGEYNLKKGAEAGSVWALNNLTDLQIKDLRAPEALPYLDKLRTLDPFNLTLPVQAGSVYYFSGQTDRAIGEFENGIKLYPKYLHNHRMFAMATIYGKKDPAKAIRVLEDAMGTIGFRPPFLLGYLAIAYNQIDEKEKVDKIVEELKANFNKKSSGDPAFFLAEIFAGTNHKEEAFDWLNKSLRAHEVELLWLKADPAFASLKNDKRYQALLSSVGFD